MKAKLIKLPEKMVDRITEIAAARATKTGEVANFSAVVRSLLRSALDNMEEESG